MHTSKFAIFSGGNITETESNSSKSTVTTRTEICHFLVINGLIILVEVFIPQGRRLSWMHPQSAEVTSVQLHSQQTTTIETADLFHQ